MFKMYKLLGIFHNFLEIFLAWRLGAIGGRGFWGGPVAPSSVHLDASLRTLSWARDALRMQDWVAIVAC